MSHSSARSLAVVYADGLSGNALFELKRLCVPEIAIGSLRSASADEGKITATVLAADQAGHLMAAVGELRRGEFVSVSATWSNVNASVRARFPVCIYNIAVPTQRLTLLSCLAGTLGGAKNYELLSEIRSPLHWHVAHLQLALNLHMTEVDLSRRLGADPSTVRRWFMKSGLLGPKRFMLWIQLSEVVCAAVKMGCTIDKASRTLGFSQPETVRKNLRNVVDLSAADIRAGRGREKLLEGFRRALGSPERS